MVYRLTVLVKVRDEVRLRLELVGKLLSIEMLDVALLGAALLVTDHMLLPVN